MAHDPVDAAEALAAAAQIAGFPRFAVAVIDLRDPGSVVRAGGDDAIYPASMIKTPLAVAVAVAERAGRLAWSDRIPVGAGDITPNDAPSPLVAGASATVGELLDLMLERSDNVATNMLIELVGRERAGADLAALGFTRTAIRRKLSGALPLIDDPGATGRNAHPAGEAVRLFAGIDRGELPGAGRIAAALERQYWNTKLSAGLAHGDRFAHKTGDTDEVSHDGGILTLAPDRRYAISVYTELPSTDANDVRLGVFMRAIRPLLWTGW